MNTAKKIILITGCSSGIGFDAANTLKERGHRVIATCRKTEDIQKLTGLGLEAILLNVDDTASIESAFKKVMDITEGKLDVLINNAGYGQIGALEDLNAELIRAQFQTNVFGLMELSRLAIPVMRKQGQGRIINISSVLGIISLPLKGAYNASKYAVEGLSDTLRLELKPAGIDVITIEPGPIESSWNHTLIDSFNQIDIENSVFKKQYQTLQASAIQKKSDSTFTKKASAVTKKLIHAIESKKPKVKYSVTFPAYLFVCLKRMLPTRMLDRLLLQVSKIS